MTRRILVPLAALLPLAAACPPLPPEIVTCEEADACGTTGSTTGEDAVPTTSDSVHTATGEDFSSGSTAPAEDTADETSGTTDQPAEAPQIVDRVVIPDYIDINGFLSVTATAAHSDGVRMQLDDGALIELTPARPGEFVGQIAAYSGVHNGKHIAVLEPWRDMLVGESVEVDYVIALPKPGSEIGWFPADEDSTVAAIALLPDGRPVELSTRTELGEPRCHLRLRDTQGELVQSAPVLESAYCRAIDLKIDRDTGVMHVLVERESGGETVWWAGEISAWGKGAKNIGTGAVGDTAHALAARPDLVAVCGSRAVLTPDKLDGLAVLLRPNQPPELKVFDTPPEEPESAHLFRQAVRDCIFSDDKLVLVGETNGRHDGEKDLLRDRLMLIESDLTTHEQAWTVAGLELGVQTRVFALDLDDEGGYHLAGYSCFDVCEPDGKLWHFAPGGKLDVATLLGPLGSTWAGPHDIAWSPAGHLVVALGELQDQTLVFKVQAFVPGGPAPLWTFRPSVKQGPQLALAAAVGPHGEVYAGGVGGFARIGS